MSRSLMVRLGAGTAALAALAAVLVAAPPQSAVADLSSGEAVPAAAVVARRIPYAMFGMHPAQVAGALSPEQLAGVTPASGLGAVTIITNGADWRDIQPTSTLDANFASLDSAIDNARSQGVTQINVLDTLGLISASFGQWDGVPGGEQVELVEPAANRVLSLQFGGDKLVGCNAVGWTEHVGVMRGLVEGGVSLGEWKDKLMHDPTQLMKAYLARAQAQEVHAHVR